MGEVFALAFTAAVNPTLLAVVTLILSLPRPKRLLLGYLVGALLTSLSCGLLLVFLVSGSDNASTTQTILGPVVDITFGILILVIAFRVATGRDRRIRAYRERRSEKAKDKPPPRWKRTLSSASTRKAFVLGAILNLPGASYVAGMDRLSKQDIGTGATVIVVLAFNAIMLAILEVPLLGYALWPDTTAGAVKRFTDWLQRRGGRIALIGAIAVGAALLIRGGIALA